LFLASFMLTIFLKGFPCSDTPQHVSPFYWWVIFHCISILRLSICKLVVLQIVFICWLFWIILLRTLVYKVLYRHVLFFCWDYTWEWNPWVIGNFVSFFFFFFFFKWYWYWIQGLGRHPTTYFPSSPYLTFWTSGRLFS
jgi:hypothetical protein